MTTKKTAKAKPLEQAGLVKQELALEEENNIVPMTDVTPNTPMQMLSQAVAGGRDLATIEKLMDLEKRWKEDRAREEFFKALSAFKSKPVIVGKDKENKQYQSRYTTIGNLVNTVNLAMAPHGLNTRWTIDQSDGISVTCILSHTLGHSESVTMSGPPDASGKKNPLQEIKSTITYLQSATFQAVTGVVSQDTPDDDGNASSNLITEDQEANLEALITEVGADRPAFLKYCKVETLADLPARNYNMACAALRSKK